MDALVAVDVGGTFTDVVVHDPSTGALRLAKALTTPEDPARGVLTALERAGVDLGSVRAFVHGTTLVINAITERKGARTALVTTAGFRDVLEIARTNRPDMYNFRYHKPRPFVPRRLRFEVRERLDPRGRVVAPIHLEDLEAVAESCRAEGVEAVAICFLHAYANPEHERQAAARLRELLPQVPVSASHEVSGLWREYERTSTVVLNAYVRPAAARYLSRLGEALQACGFRGRLRLMHSAGGTASLEQACVRPILMVESGPVAGVAGAARLGRALGDGDLVTLDVGGTTAKCSLIEHGEPRMVAEYHLERTPFSAGYPLQIPAVDIVEIGAGGGSIVRLDPLQVGPQSVGYELQDRALVFGGDTLTATDVAVAGGLARLGDPTRVAHLAGDQVRGCLQHIRRMVEQAIDRIKLQAAPQPVIVVGGGSILLGEELQGASSVVRPPHYEVANAVGAAIAQISGEVDKIYSLQQMGREEAVRAAKEEAAARATANGAHPRTVKVVEVEDVPLTYLEGDMLRVRVKAVGELSAAVG